MLHQIYAIQTIGVKWVGTAQTGPTREARIYKWASPAQSIYNWAVNFKDGPAHVGHGSVPPYLFMFYF